MVTYVSTIPEHLPECGCFLCYESATNGSLYSEIQYSNILIDGFTIDSYNDFKSNVSYYGFRRYKKRKDVLLQIAALKEQSEKVLFYYKVFEDSLAAVLGKENGTFIIVEVYL